MNGMPRVRALLIVAFGAFGLYMITSYYSQRVELLAFYGFFSLSYLFLKLLFSLRYQPTAGAAPALRTAVVIPVFNEDPRAFERCLHSIVFAQTRRPDEVWVIDDCSSTDECAAHAERVARSVHESVSIFVHRKTLNQGKRHAQKVAFTESKADVFITIDSDTVLDGDAIEQGLIPLADPRVMAVSGNVKLQNRKSNLLTRLLELRYSSSFDFERAAYSMMDSVTCASGAFTFWRASVVRDNLVDYVNQTFLGISMTYGDDRRLTNYCLKQGKVVFQSTAVAHTLVPTSLPHFIRQQVRWNKSFFRETLYAIRNLPKNRLVWWICLTEIAVWILLGSAMFFTLIIKPMLFGYWATYYYVATMVLMSYIRSANHRVTSFSTFLLAPLYALLHFSVLVPLKFYSLATLRDGRWGTRAQGVEVASD